MVSLPLSEKGTSWRGSAQATNDSVRSKTVPPRALKRDRRRSRYSLHLLHK